MAVMGLHYFYQTTSDMPMPIAKKLTGKKLLAMKRKLQREFIQQTRAEGLTNAEVVERASIFPKGVKPKVVKWPKL